MKFKVLIESSKTSVLEIEGTEVSEIEDKAILMFKKLNPESQISNLSILNPEDPLGFDIPLLDKNFD